VKVSQCALMPASSVAASPRASSADVTVKPSTGQLAETFAALGQKPISAPVDATNFSWLAMGQPTHVFDLDKLSGGIVVRLARAGEKLHLLDGTERTLTADDLVVADEKQVHGLAGVMGGWDSRVTDATKNILVEAAWFDPAAVRASSRRHGLHTDASHRFERGADFNAASLAQPPCHTAGRRALRRRGRRAHSPMSSSPSSPRARPTAQPITLRISEIKRHLGATLDGKDIGEKLVAQYLSALGCTLTESGTGLYKVQLPSWRLDLEREIDLIEEVARVYGYNKFADTLPSFAGSVVELPHAAQERALRETLLALGYSEAVSSTFVSAEEAATFSAASAVAMGNPLSAEAGMLRPALTPGMATMLAENLHRDVNAVRLFELGTVFTGSAAEVHEETGLALGATGAAAATPLHAEKDALFYQVKGALAALLAKFEGAVTFDAQSLPAWIEPGRGARALLAGEAIAVFGELSAAESQRRKLRQTAVLAEVRAQALLNRPLRQPLARELSRFQAVERDFSFVFSDSIQWQAISTALTRLGIAELQSVTPVEIFRDAKGKAIPCRQPLVAGACRLPVAGTHAHRRRTHRLVASDHRRAHQLGGAQRA
jgi:phenylalanyl-tRNA synthetase beta chain